MKIDMKNVRLQDGLVAVAVLLLFTFVFWWDAWTDVPYISDRLPGVPISKIGAGGALLAGALLGLRTVSKAAEGDRLR